MIDIPVNVKSVGNADVTTDITVNAILQDSLTATIATFQTTIVGGLPAGSDTTVWFQWTPTETGQYAFRTSTVNSQDIDGFRCLDRFDFMVFWSRRWSRSLHGTGELSFSIGFCWSLFD